MNTKQLEYLRYAKRVWSLCKLPVQTSCCTAVNLAPRFSVCGPELTQLGWVEDQHEFRSHLDRELYITDLGSIRIATHTQQPVCQVMMSVMWCQCYWAICWLPVVTTSKTNISYNFTCKNSEFSIIVFKNLMYWLFWISGGW